MDMKLAVRLLIGLGALTVAILRAWTLREVAAPAQLGLIIGVSVLAGVALASAVVYQRRRPIRVRVPAGSAAAAPARRGGRDRDKSRDRNRDRSKGRERERGANGRGRRGGRGRKNSPTASAPRIGGTVKWFDATKGYGFITPEDNAEDCFVHRSAIQGGEALDEGAQVHFEIVTDEKGRRAAANVAVD